MGLVMKKWFVIFGVFVALLIFSVLLFEIATVENGLLFTEDVADYGTEKYPVALTVFPTKLPSNAQIIDFSYYNYWHQAQDVYLELKFDSLSQMESYLSTVLASCQQICADYTPPLNGKWFIE